MYNKSKIMRSAWVSFKKAKANGGKLDFGHFLRSSWKKAKEEAATARMMSERIKFNNGMTIEVDGYEFTLNRWTKNGLDRVYIKGGRSDGYGYVDILTGRFYPKTKFYPADNAAKIVANMIF